MRKNFIFRSVTRSLCVLFLFFAFNFQLFRMDPFGTTFNCLYAAGLPMKQTSGDFSSGKYIRTADATLILECEEGSGTTVRDSSGNNNTATFSSGSAWTTGKYGNAILLDGSRTLSVPDANSLDATTAVTLIFWIKSTQTIDGYPNIWLKGSGGIWIRRDNSSEGNDFSCFTYGAGGWEVSGGGRAGSGVSISDNQWYHVAATYDKSTAYTRIYLNGALKGSSNITAFSGLTATADAVTIGSTSWRGPMDEIKFYKNYAMTADEISQDYSGFRGTFNADGYFTSSSYDCGDTDTFGKIYWTADVPAGCTLTFYTHSSNDAVNWGSWSSGYTASGSEIKSSSARYIQYKAEAQFPTGSSASILLKEVKITPAMKGISSSSGFVVKPGEAITLDIYFDVIMNTANWCTVTLIDGGSKTTVINSGAANEGTWVNSQCFRTKSYTVSNLISGGFANLRITGPKTLTGNADLYSNNQSVILVDAAGIISAEKTEFFPDPFSPNGDGKAEKTSLLLSLSSTKTVSVNIYDLKGLLVRILLDTQEKYGNVPVEWDGKDNTGKPCPIGTYLYQVKLDNDVKTGTVILTK